MKAKGLGALSVGLIIASALMVAAPFPLANAAPPGKAASGKADEGRRGKHEGDKALGEHQSIGFPNSGKLVGGKRWSDTKAARRVHGRPSQTGFGMPGLIALIHGAARKVAQRFPKSVVAVGDLSARDGGPLSGHHSHQSGRDADVGFYATDDKGRPVILESFVPFDSSGKAMGTAGLRFDDRRNWVFIESMLDDRHAEVRSIFLASWLRARLLKHAADIGAPKATIEKAAMVVMQPPNAEPHHDHFHVRVACPARQRWVCHDDSLDKGPAEPGKPSPDEGGT